jgi:hypothetical protein
MVHNKAFSEVIESSLHSFRARCWEWNNFPAFGSLVRISDTFGCVVSVETGSSDPQRYPFPYKKTEEELRAEQPQIFEFLRTTFTVVVLGYEKNKSFYYLLPPHPAKIHAFVSMTPSIYAANFFSKPDFLYLLFASQSSITHFDELLLAIFQQLQTHKKLTPKALNSFCQTLSLLTGNDYRRIKLFLKRAGSLVY